jgi:hypothetical protein
MICEEVYFGKYGNSEVYFANSTSREAEFSQIEFQVGTVRLDRVVEEKAGKECSEMHKQTQLKLRRWLFPHRW